MTRSVIFTCEQGTPEWYAARAGIPTASEFSTVMAKGRSKSEPSVTRRKYLLKLVGERMTGVPTPDEYTNASMERGKLLEGEARDLYGIISGSVVAQVGFIRRGDVGASPDSLVGMDGALEIKTALPHIQLERILQQRCPPEHLAQVQGLLWVSERKWCDFMSYWPGLPPFIIRVERDDAYIANLEAEVNAFLAEMREVQARVEELTA